MPDSSPNYSSKNIAQNSDQAIIVIAPDIAYNPEDAFFPLRIDPKDGKIKPSYQSKVCIKRFIVCTLWQKKTAYFDDLTWFHTMRFGLQKMPGLKKP